MSSDSDEDLNGGFEVSEHADVVDFDKTAEDERAEQSDSEDSTVFQRSPEYLAGDNAPILVSGCRTLSVGETDPWDNATIALMMFQYKEEDSLHAIATVPYQVQRNAIFLIDTSTLKSAEDVKCDGNGVWRGQRGELSLYYAYDHALTEVTRASPASGIGFFRTNYSHGTELTYRRVIVRCPQLKLALLQYYYKDGMEIEFEPVTYRRSYKSTQQEIKRLAGTGLKPRDIHDVILKDAGDITSIKSPCQIPNMKQIYNATAREKPSKEEDYNAFTLDCLDKVGRADALVREVATAPTFLALLATERQLDDLVRFSIADMFSVDTTFQIGDYYVTVFICRHKFLRNKETLTTPIVVCAAALHTQKDTRTYRRIVAQILSLRPELSKARLFGTDSDAALYKAVQEMLPETKHVICMVHFAENLKRKLSELSMESYHAEVLGLVLGKKTGETRFQGYVHCESDEEYSATEEQLQALFGEMHANGKKFSEYFFGEKAPMLRRHYSVELQKLADSSADHFGTNACESANAMIKRDKHHYRSLSQFMKDFRDTADSQTRNFELSIIAEGKFRIVPQYKSLEISFKRFSEMSLERKQAVRRRFHTESYDPLKPVPDVIDLANPEEKISRHTHGQELIKIHCLSAERLLEIIEVADNILVSKNPVMPAPGGSTTEFFVSGIAARSTFRATLDDVALRAHCEGLTQPCKQFEAFGICAEVLAAAMHQNLLQLVVSWTSSDGFTNSPKFELHKLVCSNAAPNSGRKPRGTAIRRGPSTRAPAASKLDDVSLLSSLSQACTSGMKRGGDLVHSPAEKKARLSYDRMLHRQELWQKVLVQDLGAKPHPQPDEYEIWLLKDCDARTTKCSGCGWQFRKSGKIPDPPNDIVAVAVGKRKFDNKIAPKAGNIYIHVQRKCVQDAVSALDLVAVSEARFVVSSVTKAQLQVDHEARLWNLLH